MTPSHLALAPVAAFASPQAQSNVQAGSNAAVTNGAFNYTDQGVSNHLNQTQIDGYGYDYGIDPQVQQSVQAGQNQSLTNGYGNVTNQDVINDASQLQSDFDYLPY